MMTWMGSDRLGDDCMDVLTSENIDTELTDRSDAVPTNAHYVLWFRAERTILIKHNEFPYRFPEFEAPSTIYLSSLAPTAGIIHDELAKWLPEHPQTKLIFQPGTFQIEEGKDTMAPIYKNTEVVACNKEEAERILERGPDDIKNLLRDMRALGPKIALVTDGPNGAYAYDGEQMLKVPMYPDPRPPVDRTGAGDAFTSTFAIALSLGKSLEAALLWGPINSMNVVQEVGAQKGLLTQEALEEHLRNAPEEYRVTKIS